MSDKRNGSGDCFQKWWRLLITAGLIAMLAFGCSNSDDDDVVNKAPTVTISSPSDGGSYVGGDLITFNGTASDAEDGALSGDVLAWQSSVDGNLGTGETFTTRDLTPGAHTITLTATDKDGAAGTITASITIAETVATSRDERGVWFITGADDASLYSVFEAMGYAVAVDRLWQAEKYRRTARGKLAEIFGPEQLQTDIFMRIIGYSDQELTEAFEQMDSESQTVVTAYADGFNRRIAEIREDNSLLPFEYAALSAQWETSIMPEDWTPSDIMAWTALMLRNFDSEGFSTSPIQLENAALYQELAAKFPADFQGMFQDLRWHNDPDALTYIPDVAGSKSARSSSVKSSAEMAALIPDISGAAKNIVGMRDTVIENMKKINAYVKMGSYAWAVAGSKTASGNPTIYSGPQMGFETPSIVTEGSIRAGGLNISGMTVPGIPGIIIGRTPHHAWSMQVGHAHTTDYYIEEPSAVFPHRLENIKIAGGADDMLFPIYRTAHGPVINPIPYLPDEYVPDPTNPIVTWKYSHWGYELDVVKALLGLARASSMDEFGAGIEDVAVSQHFCYADQDGNIAYWMSGRNPVRPEGDYRFPQGFIPGSTPLEWDADVLTPRSTDRNTSQGYYCGWNNKTSSAYGNAYNSYSYYFGPFHRAHVVDEYLSANDNLTFENIRDLALNIATTDSFGRGGNPWAFVKDDFSAAVQVSSRDDVHAALALLENWDGHFVEGGASSWAGGTDRPDAWILTDAWIQEAIRLTFEDELGTETYAAQVTQMLFNTMLHGLMGDDSGIKNNYNWFQNLSDADAPQTANGIILTALTNTLAALGDQPWGIGARGEITYEHDMIGPVHTMPFSSRSTYAHCVEYGATGPLRIESMFPMGQSGNILMGPDGTPVFDDFFFSMTDVYDTFAYRAFPLFE